MFEAVQVVPNLKQLQDKKNENPKQHNKEHRDSNGSKPYR